MFKALFLTAVLVTCGPVVALLVLVAIAVFFLKLVEGISRS